MLCHSPLMPVMFKFVGVTKYVFFKPKISFSYTLYIACSLTNEQITLALNSTNCISLLKYVNGQCLSKFSKVSVTCHSAAYNAQVSLKYSEKEVSTVCFDIQNVHTNPLKGISHFRAEILKPKIMTAFW